MTDLCALALKREADELAARIPYIAARRERGAKAQAERRLIELRRKELEMELQAERQKRRRAA